MCRCIGGNKYKIRCLRFLLLLIDTMTKLSFIKDSIKLGLTYRFRGSFQYRQGKGMEASRQAWYRRR